MVKQRIIETEEGIQDPVTVESFDVMARHMRDKGYIETEAIIKSGINEGMVLELGPGPGYLGLEWLKKTKDTALSALEISQAMIAMAAKNAPAYGLTDRVKYYKGSGLEMPFPESTFSAVFSNGSLHEWEDPVKVINEIFRVLKQGGKLFISDLRRDMSFLVRLFLKTSCKPREMRPGLESSINAAYTPGELKDLMMKSGFSDFSVKADPFGITIRAKKG